MNQTIFTMQKHDNGMIQYCRCCRAEVPVRAEEVHTFEGKSTTYYCELCSMAGIKYGSHYGSSDTQLILEKLMFCTNQILIAIKESEG